MGNFIILSDNPVRTNEKDLWGLGDAAEELQQLIAAAEDPPLTIGVFGGWGSGKTSLLSLLKVALDDAGVVRTAWFDAWRYRERQEVWPALLQCVLAELSDQARESALKGRLSDFGRAAARTFFGRGAQVVSHGLVSANDMDNILNRYA